MNRAIKGESFAKEVVEAGLAIVQFKSEWNGGCQIMAPVYEELSKHFSSEAKFLTIDIEEEKLIASEYRITELPTIMIFRKGELIDIIIGLTPKNVLITKIEDAISGNQKG